MIIIIIIIFVVIIYIYIVYVYTLRKCNMYERRPLCRRSRSPSPAPVIHSCEQFTRLAETRLDQNTSNYIKHIYLSTS